jgi:predicted transposase/invertase (TIGR01784 family)
MAGEVLISISRDEVERARLVSEYKYVVDTQSKVVYAKREGRKEGRKEGMLETARNMKADNVPVNRISAYTGLSEQQITDL